MSYFVQMQTRTILVELSHPHSLRLLEELEQVHAIKLIRGDALENDFNIPQWQKDIVLKRVKTAKDSDFIAMDEVFKNLRL